VGNTPGKTAMATQNWNWTLQVTDTMDKELRRLDIQVRADTTETEPLARLTGFIAHTAQPTTQ
jgi:general secretion pathway protein I